LILLVELQELSWRVTGDVKRFESIISLWTGKPVCSSLTSIIVDGLDRGLSNLNPLEFSSFWFNSKKAK
jgi:hypothetical protein